MSVARQRNCLTTNFKLRVKVHSATQIILKVDIYLHRKFKNFSAQNALKYFQAHEAQ